MARTVGVVESHSYAEILAAADRMAKAADVRFVRYEKVSDGVVAVVVEGDAANVQLALTAAKDGHNGAGANGLTTQLLAHVPGDVLGIFSLPGGRLWNL